MAIEPVYVGTKPIRAAPVDDANWLAFRKNLPSEVVAATGSKSIVSAKKINWNTQDKPTSTELQSLRDLNKELRRPSLNTKHSKCQVRSGEQ
ncbi:MAG: hypothetical protein KG075_00985 [Alphaproteobacteria bacterium]|nr:hypothetical protein [Alphaproteobacteria bacterium]